MPSVPFVVRFASVFCLCLGVCAVARAQTLPPANGRRIAVSIGVLSVADGDTRRFSNRNHSVVGVSYDAWAVGKSGRFTLGPYFDYFFPASQTVNNGPFTVVSSSDPGASFTYTLREQGRTQGGGLGVTGRFLLTDVTRPRGIVPYLSGGLGLYRMQAKYSVSAVDIIQTGGYALGNVGDVQAVSRSKTGLGAKIGAGLQTRAGIFGEVEYQFLPKFRLTDPDSGSYLDVSLSGFGGRVGYRF